MVLFAVLMGLVIANPSGRHHLQMGIGALSRSNGNIY